MNIDKFVSTEKQLGNKAWQKPQHVLDAIKKMRERSAARCASCGSVSMRNCGTGGGGFQAGNKCAKGGEGGGEKSDKAEKVHEGTGLPMNSDGTVTVYHHTTAANAAKIKETGELKSAGEPHVYVTTEKKPDTGYGDTAVPIRVDPNTLDLDDEFPGGRKDFKIALDKPGGVVEVKVDKSDEPKPESKGPKVPRTADDIPSVQFSTTSDSAAFVRARNTGAKRPENFSELDPARLENSTKFLSADGKSGCLVDENGDLGNVFNNSDTKGAGSAAVLSAIEHGGARTLDCYDGFLPELYTQMGFVAVAKVKWNDDYAPPNWNYDKNGRPDVVIMKYKGGPRASIRGRVGTFKPYVPLPDDRYTDDFDAAKRDA